MGEVGGGKVGELELGLGIYDKKDSLLSFLKK